MLNFTAFALTAALGVTAAVSSASAAAGSPDAVLARVQANYHQGDLCAAFEQTYFEKLRSRKKVESGRLWAKRDGRVRWTYEQPVHKDFVYDGQKASFYEPDNAQVTEFDKFEQSPLWGAVRFLWGQGKITDTFNVALCASDCPAAEEGAELVTLTPKQPIAAVHQVILDIDLAKARVRRSIVYDALGNRTEYAFKDVTIGCKVSNEKFAFTPPKGVSVIRASGDPAR